MNLSAKYLVNILEENGFAFRRENSSHKLFFNPITKKTVVVPVHGNKDLKKGTFLSILKQAGIDKSKYF